MENKRQYIRIGRLPAGVVSKDGRWYFDNYLKKIITEILIMYFVRGHNYDFIGIKIRHYRKGNPYHKFFTARKVKNILSNLPFYFGYLYINDKYFPLYYVESPLNLEYLKNIIMELNEYERLKEKLKEIGIPLKEVNLNKVESKTLPKSLRKQKLELDF